MRLARLPPLFFGTGFTVAKPAVTHVPPLFPMLMVYGGIAFDLALTCRQKLKTPLATRLLIAAFSVTIEAALRFRGLRHSSMPATAATLILQIQIPFAALLDWLLMAVVAIVTVHFRLNETISAAQILAGLIILAGLAVVSGPDRRQMQRGRVEDPAPATVKPDD